MNNSIKLGEKLKLTRENKKLSIEQLSQISHSNVNVIKKIEAGKLNPSLSPLIRLTRALGVRLGTLLDDQENLGPVVTKKNQIAKEKLKMRKTGISLAKNKTARNMEPLIVELEPNDKITKASHEGEEFIYVLDGEIIIEYGSKKYNLSAGDSIYYDSIVEHCLLTKNNKARFLAVIQEPV